MIKTIIRSPGLDDWVYVMRVIKTGEKTIKKI